MARERAQARVAREREQARLAKQREQARLAKERDKTRLAKQREQARLAKDREKERLVKQREQARLVKQREADRARQLKERETAKLAREQAREKARAQQLAEREVAKLAHEQERERERVQRLAEREAAKQAREQERLQAQAERERQRDEARRAKEEERARKDAEREAYRKAKEAERERLRAEREAARRALEGKVARASKRAHRADGLLGRSSTARLYRADAIPDQSGTTRRTPEFEQPSHARFANLRPPAPPSAPGSLPLVASLGETPPLGEVAGFDETGEALSALGSPGAYFSGEPGLAPPEAAPSGAVTPSPAPKFDTVSVEDRETSIEERLALTDEEFRRNYMESLDMSWIYHDSALEGVVYTFQELKTAIDPNITVVPDSSLQPVCEEIRRHKAAIDLVRELAQKKKEPVSVDTIKRIYLTLHPEEGDLKSVKYRKDIPQHRLYFHEYAPPDKIAYKVRQVVDWLNGPEPKKIKNPVRIAGRVHYDLLRVFPFPTDSGKVARLLMNVVLIRSGYPPAIVHSTERQRYYEALKGALPVILAMVNEAIQNGLLSIEKILDEQETRMRSFVS